MMQTEIHTGMLSIYDICRNGTRVLGPDLRYVIWTQGCPFHCAECATPESRPITNNKNISIITIASDILSKPDIKGITISGGEPFLQATSLANLLMLVLKERPELTVIVYTGYKIEDLTWDASRNLLSHTDLLIDGPYLPNFNDNRGLRGSSNQKLHFLTPRLLPWKDELENGKRKVEFHIQNDRIKAFGIPSKRMITNN